MIFFQKAVTAHQPHTPVSASLDFEICWCYKDRTESDIKTKPITIAVQCSARSSLEGAQISSLTETKDPL